MDEDRNMVEDRNRADDTADVPLHVGSRVWYVRDHTAGSLPAVLLSDGICETQRLATGALRQFAHLAYGTPNPRHELLGHTSAPIARDDRDDLARAVSERQTHEVTAPWDPTGAPGTWHLDGECEHLAHPALAPEAP